MSKTPTKKRKRKTIESTLVDSITARLRGNKQVRRTLPDGGRLHVDRQVPFLCIYRQPSDHDDLGTEQLVKGEASYLMASGDGRSQKSLADLVYEVVKALSVEFGAFLIVELWAAPEGGRANDPAVPSVLPMFEVHAQETGATSQAVEALEQRLNRVKVLKQSVRVEVLRDGRTHPAEMKALLTRKQARELNCSFIGLVVPPVYRKPDSTAQFPLLAADLRRNVSLALRQAYFEFARSQTTHRPKHFHTLGRNAVVKAVWEVDRQLAAVSNRFDYLLQLTPVNTNGAWKQFRNNRFERSPEFHYRPLPIDPAILKRELYRIPIERVEDPALHRLFEEKQEELEMKLTMLRDRDTPRFHYESLQLFGGVDDDLLTQAKALLDVLKGQGKLDKGAKVTAEAFAESANAEFAYYRDRHPQFTACAEVNAEASGLIVSRGKLLINADLSLPPSRVPALLAHEVGTHLVTYYNGRMQPFQQLYSGLAGYEELQEGLAVLAEYLVGGLSRARMRQLAGRVMAVRCLEDGADFVEAFRRLDVDYRFSQRAAYNITMRVYRGGGLTKDAVYLRGLVAILKYVQKGGELGPLLVGKMAIEHIPIIKELQYRKILAPAPITPRYLQTPIGKERLERLRGSDCSVADLVEDSSVRKGGST